MKAVAVFPEERQTRLIDERMPLAIGPDEALVRVLDVGVCGTDREICSFEYGAPPAGSRHLVLGHEALGQVVETGRRVSHLRPGDLVVPMVRRPCAREDCLACRSGRQDFCYTGEFVERGINGAHGFLTEFVTDDARYFHVLPAALREVGVLIEPLTIAQKALRQVWQVQERLPWACPVGAGGARGGCHRAVVLGAGPVGLLGAMTFRNAGFDTVVYSRAPAPNDKAALVESIGARYLSSEQVPVADLAAAVGNIDVVFEAVGASRISFDVMRVLGTNGIFVFTGVPGRKAPMEVDTDLLMRNLVLKNQVVFGTVNAGAETFADAIRDLEGFVARWPAAVRALITGRHPMARYPELVHAHGSSRGIKDVIAVAAE